ncbi:tRNA pseudouridine synthase B [Candidatus Nitrospira nitrificans]|uniref:tRNA pseudouridine synthase B n=2 Tax=Candidatus Nitrospira nitrificans TaxID=1742973 RepID=A0A0S4LM98_9BACT|nr:tRNA pseudouridine synthase B [Candidatus Nitrospira nitrificans]
MKPRIHRTVIGRSQPLPLKRMDRTDTTTGLRDALDGVLIVHKEAGWTSHDVVAKVRRLLGGSKVGHAGTLDPSATGVLPILVGRATRVAEYLINWDKEYHAVLRLGETTDTQDATGQVLSRVDPCEVTEDMLQAVIARFRGEQRQLPPMYSAVKVGGQPLYKAARAGRTVDRAERSIMIHQLEITALHGRDVALRIVCSKGTYVRTLCADIGQALGVGGHLSALERRRVGPLSIEQALTIDQVADHLTMRTLSRQFISVDQLLVQFPAVVVNAEQAQRVLNGSPIFPARVGQLPPAPSTLSVRLKDEAGQLLAIGTHDAGRMGSIRICKVLSLLNH